MRECIEMEIALNGSFDLEICLQFKLTIALSSVRRILRPLQACHPRIRLWQMQPLSVTAQHTGLATHAPPTNAPFPLLLYFALFAVNE